MVRAITMFLVLMLGAGPAYADNAGSGNAQVIAAARSYLDAYQTLDLVRLEALYADDVRFNDPTSVHAQGVGGPFVWNGRAAVLAGIRGWSTYVRSLNYDIERIYEASGHVVFVGAVNPVVATPDGLAHYRYSIVTIITIQDGRVVEHRDYTDYAGAELIPRATQQPPLH